MARKRAREQKRRELIMEYTAVRRASLCGLSVAAYKERLRPMSVRRAAARLAAFRRRNAIEGNWGSCGNVSDNTVMSKLCRINGSCVWSAEGPVEYDESLGLNAWRGTLFFKECPRKRANVWLPCDVLGLFFSW